MSVPPRASLPPSSNHHGLRRQAIVEMLLRDVVHGRLRPGEHLVTQALAERFGVSHTPVREALVALAGMGFADLVPNRGAIVRRVTTRDVQEICQVRRLLECAAVRAACGRIDPAELDALRNDLRRLVAAEPPHGPRFVEEARAVDSRLHDRIAAASRNTFLAHELGRLTTLFRAFRDVAWEREEARNDYHRLAQEAREHLAIVEALADGDRRRAARAMARHILSGCAYWTRTLPESAPATPPAADPDSRRHGEPR